MKAKPKTNTPLIYMGECCITLNPNQIWDVELHQDIVYLRWRCIMLKISLTKYRMMFKEV